MTIVPMRAKSLRVLFRVEPRLECGRADGLRLAKQTPNRGYPTDYILYEYIVLSGPDGTVVFVFPQNLQICSFALAAV